MKRSNHRMFAEKILFEMNVESLLLDDYAYSKYKALHKGSKYFLCNHWVDNNSVRRLRYRNKRYYQYRLLRQWEEASHNS